jgi:hypothetical protein
MLKFESATWKIDTFADFNIKYLQICFGSKYLGNNKAFSVCQITLSGFILFSIIALEHSDFLNNCFLWSYWDWCFDPYICSICCAVLSATVKTAGPGALSVTFISCGICKKVHIVSDFLAAGSLWLWTDNRKPDCGVYYCTFPFPENINITNSVIAKKRSMHLNLNPNPNFNFNHNSSQVSIIC